MRPADAVDTLWVMSDPTPDHSPHQHADPAREGVPGEPLARRGALRLLGIAAGAAALGSLASGCASGGNARARRAFRDREPVGGLTSRVDRPYRSINPAPLDTGVYAGAVIPRTIWTRETIRPWLADRMGRIRRITVHHDGLDVFTSKRQADAMDRLELFRSNHVDRLGWADIGYHFAIDPAGRVYECRPTAYQGAHVKDHNEQNLGVLVMGHHSAQSPSPEALHTLASFVAAKQKRYGVPGSRVYTHRELRPTECPGENLQARFDEIRRRGMVA